MKFMILLIFTLIAYGIPFVNASDDDDQWKFNPPQTLKEAQREIMVIDGDGECLFRALSEGGNFQNMTPQSLREFIFDCIFGENGLSKKALEEEDPLAHLVNDICTNEEGERDAEKQSAFAEFLLNPGMYEHPGMDLVLPILSKAFGVNVYLYDPDGNFMKDESIVNDKPSDVMPIYLVYHGSHYDATIYTGDLNEDSTENVIRMHLDNLHKNILHMLNHKK